MSVTGAPIDRTDGVLKVTGRARYAADHVVPGMVHAVMVTSTIPHGKVESIDSAACEQLPGVRLVMTPFNAPKLPKGGKAGADTPTAGHVMALLQDTSVHYNNQPIAVVVADTLEQAREAATRLVFRYREEAAVLDFAQARARRQAEGRRRRPGRQPSRRCRRRAALSVHDRRRGLHHADGAPQPDGAPRDHRRLGWRRLDAV